MCFEYVVTLPVPIRDMKPETIEFEDLPPGTEIHLYEDRQTYARYLNSEKGKKICKFQLIQRSYSLK